MEAVGWPPMSLQTTLSVGDSVKNRETSEMKEFVALPPRAMSTNPPASGAREEEMLFKPCHRLQCCSAAGRRCHLMKRPHMRRPDGAKKVKYLTKIEESACWSSVTVLTKDFYATK